MHTRPWEEAVPAVLVVMTVGPEMSPNLLNRLLSLTVSLRSLKKTFQTLEYKLWPTVGDNILWNAEGIMEEGLCCFEGCGYTLKGNSFAGFREYVH